MENQYPKAIASFHTILEQLPGVLNVCSGIDPLHGLTNKDLSLVELGHLPHAALRRTDGGLEHEVLFQVEFQLEPKPASWKTLEFLAWFVRDQARGGELMQLRPFALPPLAGQTVQLGHTLKFQIDVFLYPEEQNLDFILEKVAAIRNSLEQAIDWYGSAFGPEFR